MVFLTADRSLHIGHSRAHRSGIAGVSNAHWRVRAVGDAAPEDGRTRAEQLRLAKAVSFKRSAPRDRHVTKHSQSGECLDCSEGSRLIYDKLRCVQGGDVLPPRRMHCKSEEEDARA